MVDLEQVNNDMIYDQRLYIKHPLSSSTYDKFVGYLLQLFKTAYFGTGQTPFLVPAK